MQSPFRLSLLLAAAALQTACVSETVWLDPEPVPSQASIATGAEVGVAEAAEGVPEAIGNRTLTVFAIPAGDLHLQRGPTDLMKAIGGALEAAGYRPVPASARPGEPVLVCHVTRMKFKNYTWFMPFIKTWGDMELSLSLVDGEGRARWQKSYVGAYDEGDWGVSFMRAVNLSLDQILAQAARDFASAEFRAACCEP
jgi:hypothetical protein